MAAVAGLAWVPAFGGWAVAPIVAGAAGLAAALSLAGGTRLHLWQALVLTCVAWLATACALLFRDAGLQAPAAAVLALSAAPKAALGIIPPLPDRPDLLVLPHALAWFAGFAAAELSWRTRSPILPAVPPVLALAVALGLGPGGSDQVPVTALLVALAGLGALVRVPAPRPRWGPPLALTIALAAGIAGPVLPGLPARPPFDARPLVPPAAVAAAGVDPLDEVAAWLSRPDQALFTVRSPVPEDWRLVTVDRFDGVRWSTTALFVPSGGRVPAARPSGPSDAIEQRVSVQGLEGLWLPAADRPTSVTGASVAVDPGSGAILATSALRPGLEYRAESAVPRPRAGVLAAATAAADRADLALPPGPQAAELRELALQVAAGAVSPFQEAVVLAAWLRGNEVSDAAAAPGHSYRAVEFFLETTHRGSSEQFSTAFALMARAIGLPTRIAVGFRPGRPVDGAWQVRGGDVLAWPEVELTGAGWVPFYPTPDQAGPASGGTQVPAGETPARQAIDQQAAALPTPAPVQRPAHGPAVRPAGWPTPAGRIVVAAAVVALAVPAAAGAMVWAGGPAWRRRRRRRRRTPAGRVAGAWSEALDSLRRAGVRTNRAMSARDVAALAAAAKGEAAGSLLGRLADAVNRAGFAPEPAGPADAAAAWRDCDALRRVLR
jgi:transglutaminase-like putative cysteine protease